MEIKLIKPRLIQRGEIRHTLPQANSSFSKEIYLEYMCDPGFTLKCRLSLKEMQRRFHQAGNKFQGACFMLDSDGGFVQMLHFLSGEDLAQYTKYLNQMRVGTLDLAEKSHFETYIPELIRTTDFWWDVDNHVMWTFHTEFMVNLPVYLANEFQLMDARRAQQQLGGLSGRQDEIKVIT